jgi:hypothetical protein
MSTHFRLPWTFFSSGHGSCPEPALISVCESVLRDALNFEHLPIRGAIVAKGIFSDLKGPSYVRDGSQLDTVFTRLPTSSSLR